jgi:hypothetical protein
MGNGHTKIASPSDIGTGLQPTRTRVVVPVRVSRSMATGTISHPANPSVPRWMRVRRERPVNAAGESPVQGGVGHLGSYPGDGQGDRTVEASGTEIRFGRVSERTGRNASEA